jgi:hypothetical protein
MSRLETLLAVVVFACVVAVTTAAIPRAQPVLPPLTEIETLRIENVRLASLVLQRELDEFQAKRAKLKADLEAARPGWTYDLDTGKFVVKTPPTGNP